MMASCAGATSGDEQPSREAHREELALLEQL
jgi:hypothetical protein